LTVTLLTLLPVLYVIHRQGIAALGAPVQAKGAGDR
jgi:hypothetical protein